MKRKKDKRSKCIGACEYCKDECFDSSDGFIDKKFTFTLDDVDDL